LTPTQTVTAVAAIIAKRSRGIPICPRLRTTCHRSGQFPNRFGTFELRSESPDGRTDIEQTGEERIERVHREIATAGTAGGAELPCGMKRLGLRPSLKGTGADSHQQLANATEVSYLLPP
jgi:hypothetical protein